MKTKTTLIFKFKFWECLVSLIKIEVPFQAASYIILTIYCIFKYFKNYCYLWRVGNFTMDGQIEADILILLAYPDKTAYIYTS